MQYLLLSKHRNLFFSYGWHNRCRNDAHLLWYNAQFLKNAWKRVLQEANFIFSTPYFMTKYPIRRFCTSTCERFEALEVWTTFCQSFWYTLRDCNLIIRSWERFWSCVPLNMQKHLRNREIRFLISLLLNRIFSSLYLLIIHINLWSIFQTYFLAESYLFG